MSIKLTKKRKILFLILILMVAVFGFMVLLLRNLFDSPSQGVITGNVTSSSQKSEFNQKPTYYSNKFVSFNYPASLSEVPSPKIVSPVIANASFKYPDIQTWYLNIDILNVPAGDLASNNSYEFRKINPNIYQQSTLNINGEPVIVMTDKSSSTYSKVAFLVNGTYQATISLTGDDLSGDQYLDATMVQVLSSWKWQ